MGAFVIDTLEYARKLEKAGFTRSQAEAQAEIFSEYAEAQDASLQKRIEERDKELATKADLKSGLRELELSLRNEIERTKYSLLKWQVGLAVTILVIMAKGFGWLGF